VIALGRSRVRAASCLARPTRVRGPSWPSRTP